MITGFNTDIDHQDRVFHIQTEDKGLDNPMVESLIYCGGEIIDSRQVSYAELTEDFSEEELLRRMEQQHQAMIRDIRSGKYDTGEPRPFGHNIITNRSLDEVVMHFLEHDFRIGEVKFELVEEQVLREGTRPEPSLRVARPENDKGLAGVPVGVTLVSTAGEPRHLFFAYTDTDGLLQASFEIPRLGDADGAIVFSAIGAENKAEIRRLVQKPKQTASEPA